MSDYKQKPFQPSSKSVPKNKDEEEDLKEVSEDSNSFVNKRRSQSFPYSMPPIIEMKQFPQSLPREKKNYHYRNTDTYKGGVHSSESCCLTMTGTMKSGKHNQVLNLKVHLSREELDTIEHAIITTTLNHTKGNIGLSHGPHVFLFTILILPVIFILATIYSFYLGTMTWYNVLVYYSEQKTLAHKIFVPPVIIIMYPFLIIISIVGHGLYVAFHQVSWYFSSWKQKVLDWEKGFYGWLCNTLDLEDCSPYQVVVLSDILPERAVN